MFFPSSNLLKPSAWMPILVGVLLFWLSATLLLDLVVMPSLFVSGMMSEPGFATAGYTLFSVFNRVELLCAGLIFTGVLVATLAVYSSPAQAIFKHWNFSLTLATSLLAIALLYTYGLTPEMSSIGLNLNALTPTTEVPTAMNLLHGSYWLMEVVKLGAVALLLRAIARQMRHSPWAV